MGCHPPGSQGSEIPGNVGSKEYLPLEGKGEAVCGLCLPCTNGGGPVPLFWVWPSLPAGCHPVATVSLPSGQGFPGTPAAGAPHVCIGRTSLGQDRSTGSDAPAQAYLLTGGFRAP